MARSLLFGAIMCVILLAAATTRSDVAGTSDEIADPTPLPEPITETAVQPVGGDATPQKDPFAPYDVGPPESVWPYESLTVEEQAVVDRGRNVAAWSSIHNAYAIGVREQSQRAAAEAAQHLLGVDSIDDTGVVP